MEKILKINIPNGFEIDQEKSTFREIVLRPIKFIDYYTIAKSLFNEKKTYYITQTGLIGYSDRLFDNDLDDSTNGLTKSQLNKVLAINKLFNIAEYYNQNKNNEVEYIIKYNKYTNGYYIQLEKDECGLPKFYNYEDAISVINNPNFKSILDNIFK